MESNIHDLQMDAPSNGELAMSGPEWMPIIPISPLDPRPPWGTLTKFQTTTSCYIHDAWHNLPSPSSQSLINVGHGPPRSNPLDTRLFNGMFRRMGYAYLNCLEALIMD